MLEPGPHIAPLNLHRLAGTVEDASGMSLERKIIATPRSHPTWYATVSDPDTGAWSLEHIPAGTYRVVVIDHTREFQPWAVDFVAAVPME